MAYIGEAAVRKCRGICYGRACPVSCPQKDDFKVDGYLTAQMAMKSLPSPSTLISCVPEIQERDRITQYVLLYVSFSLVFFSLVWFCFGSQLHLLG